MSSFRTPWIVALLLAALALVAMLALQAHRAVGMHRTAAEDVLRDYAALAGDELIRRVTVEVAYSGYLPALRILHGAALAGESELLAEPGDRSLSPEDARALSLVRSVFLYDPDADRLVGSAPANELPGEWLRSELPRVEIPKRSGYTALHGTLERGPVSYVFTRLGDEAGPYVGFELERDALAPFFEAALARGPLLPPSVGRGELANDSLFVRLLDGGGNELYRGGSSQPPELRAARRPPPDYLEILEGVRAEVGIDPQEAALLVIGGLPRSRLPTLLALLALTAALVVAALFLLQRERVLARMRTDFVSRVSHELRTPLTQIRMFAETMKLGRVRNSEEATHALAIIDREARRLSGLVENVLQFSRSERDAVRLSPRPQRVAEVVAGLVEELEPLLDGGSVEVDVPDDLTVVADADALHQSLLNLLDNALKYGPSGQEIQVGAARGGEWVAIWVDDEGPGVPAGERERIWRPFQRVGNGPSASGTGIGLAVVSDLVRRHGGRCRMETGARGGARVTLELPA